MPLKSNLIHRHLNDLMLIAPEPSAPATKQLAREMHSLLGQNGSYMNLVITCSSGAKLPNRHNITMIIR